VEEDLSQADLVAALPEDQREQVLADLDMDELLHNREFWLRPSQLAAINSTHRLTVCLAGRGWGKAADVDTPLAMPGGWTTMGDVRVGDRVLDEHGRPTRVIAKTPTWIGSRCFRVRFSDDSSVVVSAEHQWRVEQGGPDEDFHSSLVLTTMGLFSVVPVGEPRFRLPEPRRRWITGVEPVPSVPTVCIQVDNPTQLFLLGAAMVPTHNSRVLSEAAHKYAMDNPGCTIGVLGKTAADVRDVLVLGASGILKSAPLGEAPDYKPHLRRLVWANGSQGLLFSAIEPDTIRGPEFHFSIADEVSSYRNNPGAGLANPFDQLRIATRLPTKQGYNQVLVATTPKRLPIILNILREAEESPERVLVIRGSTFANRHLDADYQETIRNLYEGTTLGRQELEGELLFDVEGAMLTQDVIDEHRVTDEAILTNKDWWKTLPHRVVGVDPSVSAKPNDECGIVVVGATGERRLDRRHAYVLEDASLLGTPDRWAQKVVEVARKYSAYVVAEANQGGEMVRLIIQAKDRKVPVLLVHAKLNKVQRAEPVAAAYQRGRVHHLDWFEVMESQWTGWVPDQGMASPDRLDAATHAVTALLIKKPKGSVGSLEVAQSPANKHIGTLINHDPFTGSLSTTRYGSSGLSESEIKERLKQATDIDEKDLRSPVEDELDSERRHFRTAGRPRRIPLPLNSITDPRTSRLYGPPSSQVR
jgi:phage terminase large subunit-like protein